MNKKSIAILGIAAVSASVAILMSSVVTAPPAPAPVEVVQAPAGPDPRELTEVLVASDDIKVGQQLTALNMSWQSWPKTALPPQAIQRAMQPNALNDYEKATATASIMKGELISDTRVFRAERSGYVATALPEGYRAFSIRLEAQGANAAGGMILPNDRVDIYITGQAPQPGRSEVESTLLMQDIRIIAIDQKLEKDDGSHAMIGSTATLELTPEQIVSINKAVKNGTLSFALRPLKEKGHVVAEAEKLEAKPQASEIQLIRFGVASTLN